MRELWLYHSLSRLRFLNYRAKIMSVAFIGTHIPLIVLASYLALQSAPNWQVFLVTVGTTLIATLAGTVLTLVVLNQLLRPVLLTSATLRLYRESRQKSPLPRHYTDEVGRLMADTDSTITHLEAARDALEHLDATTGLPNRKKLLELMQRPANLSLPFTIAVVRFSNFHRIAQTLDLAQAEDAARHFARRLEAWVEYPCTVARISPSEFALLADQDAPAFRPEPDDKLRSLIRNCGQELPLKALDIKPEVLCGVARFPADSDEPETLLDHAIAAASQATSTTPVFLHSNDARKAALERFSLEQELRRALDRGEFRLHYQPVIDLDAGKAVGAEALIRWHHPERGLLLPAEFIASAEASGLIEPMGLYVMRQACEQLREWNAGGPQGMHVAINLSAHQFLNLDLARQIERVVGQAHIDPSQIEIELTETAAMVDLDHTQRMFAALRELGISIAIDDFGTGYASMSCLRNLPFDKLKIDREFVDGVHQKRDAQAICRSLIALCRGLGLAVVAEGAEKDEEVRYLSRQGCHLFQGFYFAKPLAAREFVSVVNSLAASLADTGGKSTAGSRAAKA